MDIQFSISILLGVVITITSALCLIKGAKPRGLYALVIGIGLATIIVGAFGMLQKAFA